MHWFFLVMAILSEVAGTVCMKLSAGFSKTLPSVLMWVFYGICFAFLAFTLKKINVGVAYAIWSGVGTALIAAVGVIYFREPLTLIRCIGLLTIIVGVVILNLSGSSH